MRSPYAIFGTSRTLETDGVWLDFGDFKFKIARAGGANRHYQRVLDEKLSAVRPQVQTGTLPEEVDLKLSAEVFAETVLLGWENVTDRAGKIIPFTKENAVALLLDLPDLHSYLRREANNFARFRDAEQRSTAKN
jgi:hypothetical protein